MTTAVQRASAAGVWGGLQRDPVRTSSSCSLHQAKYFQEVCFPDVRSARFLCFLALIRDQADLVWRLCCLRLDTVEARAKGCLSDCSIGKLLITRNRLLYAHRLFMVCDNYLMVLPGRLQLVSVIWLS